LFEQGVAPGEQDHVEQAAVEQFECDRTLVHPDPERRDRTLAAQPLDGQRRQATALQTGQSTKLQARSPALLQRRQPAILDQR
jgi:hypothetical protein